MATIKLRPDAETEWTEIVTLRGAAGADGQTAYEAAVEGGYKDDEATFMADLAAVQGLAAELAAI
jgi:hypothetical protein